MLRKLPHLTVYMPASKDARRLIPDPENEPDLSAISKQFPLPGADDDDLSEVGVEDGASKASSVHVAPTIQEPPTKIPRMVMSLFENGSSQLPAMDVSQARAELLKQAAISALKNQIKMQQEMAALRQLQEIQEQRRREQSTAATMIAYAELLRNSTLQNWP